MPSVAVAVKVMVVPRVCGGVLSAATEMRRAGGGCIRVMALLVPVMLALPVSVAVSVRLPIVRSVAEKMPTPFVSRAFPGRLAAPSLLVKCTVPL